MTKTLGTVASELFSKSELPLVQSQERLVHITKLVQSLQAAYPTMLDLSLLTCWLATTSEEVSTALAQVVETKKAIRDEYYKA